MELRAVWRVTKASVQESKGGGRLTVMTCSHIWGLDRAQPVAAGTHLYLHFSGQKSENLMKFTDTALQLLDLTVPGRDLI